MKLGSQANWRGDEVPWSKHSLPSWEQQDFWLGPLVHVEMIPDLECFGEWCDTRIPYKLEAPILPAAEGGDCCDCSGDGPQLKRTFSPKVMCLCGSSLHGMTGVWGIKRPQSLTGTTLKGHPPCRVPLRIG